MKHKEYIIPIGEEAKEFDEIFIGVIRKQPELIRCKDCRHWRANTQLCSVFSGLCTVHRMPPDGYCSEAKRKEE